MTGQTLITQPRIFLLGKKGQLGWELQRTLQPLGPVYAFDTPEIDLAHPDSTIHLIHKIQPQIIINATAYTAVDQAESQPELAMAVNAEAPGVLAAAAAKLGSVFIHYSTDYVFDGNKGAPYFETDIPNPLNVYGRSKLLGEQAVSQVGGAFLVLRTSWVYSLRRDSFVTKVLQWAKQNETLRIVDDQISNPTWARMLAEISALMLARAGLNPYEFISNHAGLYHLAGDGFCSRFEWAKMIIAAGQQKQVGILKEILPAKSTDFPSPAARPQNSSLNCQKFFDHFQLKLPNWQDTLHMILSEHLV